MKRLRVPLLGLLLLVLHLWLGGHAIRFASQTYDEAVHLALGHAHWKAGPTGMNIENPPLTRLWLALPLLPLRLDPLRGSPEFLGQRLFEYADRFLYQGPLPGPALLDKARFFQLWTLAPLAFLLIGLWAAEAGEASRTAAWTSLAFCPAVLAFHSLATTDAAAALGAVLFLYCLSRCPEANGRLWPVLAGASAGLAVACKFTALIWVASAPLLSLAYAALRRRRPSFQPGAWAAAVLAGAVILAAAYSGDLSVFGRGLQRLWAVSRETRWSYLLGEHGVGGRPYFFLVVLLVKTPLPMLALAALGVWRLGPGLTAFAFLPALVWLAAASVSATQLGARHILPVTVLLTLFAGRGAGRLWEKGGAWSALTGLLLLWQAGSVVAQRNEPLAYFNELVGGPRNGWRVLLNADLDWGQGLKDLAAELKRRGDPAIYLSYFGTADPSAYGIRYAPVAPFGEFERRYPAAAPTRERQIFLAVSVNNRFALYFSNKRLFGWLDEVEPVYRSSSIWLYDLTGLTRALKSLALLLNDQGRRKEAVELLERAGFRVKET